jgi:hypothetical protein
MKQRNYKQKKINGDIEGKTESTHRKQEDNKKQALSFVCVCVCVCQNNPIVF